MYQIKLNDGSIETIATDLKDAKDVVKAIKGMLIDYSTAKYYYARVNVHKYENDVCTFWAIDERFGDLVKGYTDGGAKWLTEYVYQHLANEDRFGGPMRRLD